MPLPSLSQVHAVDVPLSNISQAIIQREENFVASRVFPMVPVGKKSDRYYIFNQPDFFRTDATIRGPGARAPQVGYALSSDTYDCMPWEVEMAIDDQVRANADAGLDLERSAVRRITLDLLIRKEVDWVSKFFGASIWSTSTTVAITWDNANSTPIEDVRARAYVMQTNTGFMPNTLVIGPNVEKRLLDHPDIIDRIKYTQRGIASRDLLAAMFGVQRLLVIGASRNTAVETSPAAAGTYANIAGNHALLLYVDPNPGLMSPSAGLTFVWNAYTGGSEGVAVDRRREESIRSDVVRAAWNFDHKVVATGLGEFFTSCVAS